MSSPRGFDPSGRSGSGGDNQDYEVYVPGSNPPSAVTPLPSTSAPAKQSNLPTILGIAIALVGIVIAAIILITSDSGDNGGSAGGTTTSGASLPTGDNGDMPDDLLVPEGVTVTQVYPSGTGSGGKAYSGLFETDDPQSAYDKWVALLTAEGYNVFTQQSGGTGSDFYFVIEASGNGYGSIQVAWTAGSGAIITK